MSKLENITCKDVSLETTVKIIHTTAFPIIMYGCENWTEKKSDRKKIDLSEILFVSGATLEDAAAPSGIRST